MNLPDSVFKSIPSPSSSLAASSSVSLALVLPRQDDLLSTFESKYEFMAPIADLMNYGEACTRIRYDDKSKIFEIYSVCNINVGDEITFWYGDDCQDVFSVYYGFSSPMMKTICRVKD